MFVDACREAIAGGRGVLSIGEASKEALARAGIVSFFSCDPKDSSYEIDDLKQGSFTYCVLQAIKSGSCNTVVELDKNLRENVPLTNQKYNKPVQLPYAIIQPAEKGELPIFFSRVQQKQREGESDLRIAMLAALYANGKLEPRYYEQALDVLTLAQTGSPNEKKLRMIIHLLGGQVTGKSFGIAWDALERALLAEPTVQKLSGGIR